jgi:hypothetical protein
MINRKSVFIVLIVVCNFSYAQVQRNTGQMTGRVYAGGTIETFTSPVETYPEENYLQGDWAYGSINLINTEHLDIKQIPLKFNVVSNKVEIKTERVVKEIPVSLIRSIEILNPNSLLPTVLVNGSQIGMDSETFYEELNSEGRFNGYILHSYIILPADYNPQFDSGSKVDRVILLETFFLRDRNTSEFHEIKLKKKSLVKVLEKIDESYAQKVKRYSDGISDKYDLQKLLKDTQTK